MPSIDDILARFEKSFNQLTTQFSAAMKEQIKLGVLERADIVGLLEELGYTELLAAFQEEMITSVGEQSGSLLRELGLSDIPDTGLLYLERLATNSAHKLASANQSIIDAMVEAGIRYKMEGAPFSIIVEDLQSKIDDMARRVMAEAHTGIRNFQRATRFALYEEAGIEKYYYSGPIDDVTRDVCMQALTSPFQSTGWTLADINSGPVDFITGGGYNCRHEFLPFDKKEGESLKQRADRFEPT